MRDRQIILLAGKWDTTPIVYNFLQEHFGVMKVLMEDGVSRKEFLKKRAKKLGWITVCGQILFQLLIGKLLNKTSHKRIKEILQQYELSRKPIPEEKIIHLSSVNSDQCLRELNQLQPNLIIVHGTRIISKRILTGVTASFINIHAGITPRYRGSHGAYWALVNGDEEHCGVTVHLVDAGIDTGKVLFQEKIPITTEDNFATYGYLQLGVGLRLLKSAVQNFFEKTLVPVEKKLDSVLWHHPTLWGYISKRIFKKVK
jgi:folate-dependent phosphoribosylglycinamide formyltransferase PurN